jgi:small subunit ribosomal protein S1
VRNITEFGLFVALNDEIDGMVHISDISWEDQSDEILKSYKVGDKVMTKILEMDADKERVALGIKQLSEDPFKGAMDGVARGSVVTCTVTEIEGTGVKVSVNENLNGYIKKIDISSERSEQRPERLAVGEKVDAKIMKIDAKTRELTLSIKAYEQEQNKKAMEEFGSTESGASLGDILGAALGDDKK